MALNMHEASFLILNVTGFSILYKYLTSFILAVAISKRSMKIVFLWPLTIGWGGVGGVKRKVKI